MRLVDPDRPGRRIDVEERRIASFDGTEIAYHVAGVGRPVLLASGLGGTYPIWRHLYRYLGDRYRFIAWDYRGLHRSGRPLSREAIGVEEHTRDALALLDAEGVEVAAVLGWSSGVQVAVELCRMAPERVAALVAVAGTAGRPWDALQAAPVLRPFLKIAVRVARRVPRLTRFTASRLLRLPEALPWLKRTGIVAPTLDEEVFADLAEDFAGLDIAMFLDVLESFARHDAGDVLPTLQVPTLVLTGDRDLLTSLLAAEELAGSIPGAQLTVLRGGTHYAIVEFPEMFNLRVEKFLLENGWAPLQAA